MAAALVEVVLAAAGPINETAGATGSELPVTAAAAAGVPEPLPISRRATAAAAHSTGIAAGESPRPPNHDTRVLVKPPDAAATRAAAGATATVGVAVSMTAAGGPVDPAMASALDGATGTAETSTRPETAWIGSTDDRSAVRSIAVTSASAAVAAIGERSLMRWSRSLAAALLAPGPSGNALPGTAEVSPGVSADDPCAPGAGAAAPVLDSLPEPPGELTPIRPAPRVDDRDGPVLAVDAVGAEAAASDAFDPLDPAEPVVSANAHGADATAEPTPSATANAPTRPT